VSFYETTCIINYKRVSKTPMRIHSLYCGVYTCTLNMIRLCRL